MIVQLAPPHMAVVSKTIVLLALAVRIALRKSPGLPVPAPGGVPGFTSVSIETTTAFAGVGVAAGVGDEVATVLVLSPPPHPARNAAMTMRRARLSDRAPDAIGRS